MRVWAIMFYLLWGFTYLGSIQVTVTQYQSHLDASVDEGYLREAREFALLSLKAPCAMCK